MSNGRLAHGNIEDITFFSLRLESLRVGGSESILPQLRKSDSNTRSFSCKVSDQNGGTE